MTTLKERFEENLPYENTFVDSEAQQATLTFIKQELMLLTEEVEKKIDERTDYDFQTNKAVAIMNNSYRTTATIIRTRAESI